MKKTFIKNLAGCILLILITIINYSCSSVSYASSINSSRTINIDKNFTGVRTQAAIEITYTQNTSKPIAIITGPKEIIEGMSYSINKNGILSFELPKNKKNIWGKISIELNGGPLYNYEASSSGSIVVTTPVNVNNTLNFAISSSAEILMKKDVDSNTNNINVAVSSSGKMIFQGSVIAKGCNFATSSSAYFKTNYIVTNSINYAGSSVGTFEGVSLKADKANFSVSSGAGLEIGQTTIGSLSASASSGADISCGNVNLNLVSLIASSGGTITIKGNTKEAVMSASSGGAINAQNLNIKQTVTRNSSSGGSINLKKRK